MTNIAQLEALLRARLGYVKRSMGKNGLELITRCPVCGKRKLSINATTGIYKCWRGCTGGHVNKLLGTNLELQISALDQKRIHAPRDVEFPGELVPLSQLPSDHHALGYLQRRGFNLKQLEEWYGVSYCPCGRAYAGGLFQTSNTIVIPVYMEGKLKGWQARLLYDPDKVPESDYEALGFLQDEDGDWVKPPKYFTMPGMEKGAVLWNYDWAMKSQVIAVCEGVFDAMAVGRCAIATFGKGVSDTQTSMLLQGPWKLILGMLDPDAEKENRFMCASLKARGGVAVPVTLQGYKDAGEAPQLEIWQQIDEALRKAGGDLRDYRFIV